MRILVTRRVSGERPLFLSFSRYPFRMLRSSLLSVAQALTASLILSACALSPGQHLNERHLTSADSPDSARFELVPITPKLLAVQEATNGELERTPVELLNYRPEPYRVGAGDILHITVWDYPEMTAPSGPQQSLEANGRVVRPDGTLYYPYVGAVQAAGLTVEELRASIAQSLTKVITEPQVDVAVIGYTSRKVVLSGAFRQPGAQPITSVPLSLLEAVGEAGAVADDADMTGLVLKRDGQEYELDLDSLNLGGVELDQIYLKDGDHLHLASNDRRRVYVMGEVNQPRVLPFRTRTLSLADVLGEAGGLSQETSRGKAVYVIRGVEDLAAEQATIFQLDAQSPAAFVLAENFQVEPKDVVYVGAAGITRWNRFISQLFPSANLLRTGVRIDRDITR